jgi:hypothetical protein
MIDHLLRDLQVLQKADILIGRIWLKVVLRRFGLTALASLIAVFGLGMANLAGFQALQVSVGPIWAATIVSGIDFVIAAIVLALAAASRPGPELEVALEVRKMAVDALQADARELKTVIETVGHEVKNVKATLAHLVHDPFEVAAKKLLVPAVLSLLRGLRSKKEQA